MYGIFFYLRSVGAFMLSIGLMSGTSMDGIDAALIETDGTPNLIKDLGHIFLPYHPTFRILLKAAEYVIRKHQGRLAEAAADYPNSLQHYLTYVLKITPQEKASKLAELSDYLPLTLENVIQHSTQLHALTVMQLLEKTKRETTHIDVVGYHGQTMFHHPAIKISVVLGDGKALANQLGITVVNDFRRNDVLAGGEGAPFAPLYHQALAIRDQKIPVAVVNCGGIANVTLVGSSAEQDLIAFDTGPGNGLIDLYVRQRTNGKENMDKDGQYGLQGQINATVLNALYQKSVIKNGKNYFDLPAPKSLDIGDMALIPELEALSFEDACATLEAFTADSIVTSLMKLNIKLPTYWILAGGGWHNRMIRQTLEKRLAAMIGPQVQVGTADEAGWNSQAMEAQIFAYLAIRSLQNKPLSLPNTTRVPKPLSGGCIHLPPQGPTVSVSQLLKHHPEILSNRSQS